MIEAIILPAMVGVLFADLSGIPQAVSQWLCDKNIYGCNIPNPYGYGADKFIPGRLKPFDCGLCLSFWLSLANSTLICKFTFVTSIGIAATSAVVAVMVKAIYDRINR